MNQRIKPLRRAGLTLIELMVTLTITAVLLGIAVPSMQEMIARRRVAAVAIEMVSDLRYMASTGLQRNMASQLDIKSNCYVVSLDPAGFGACDCAIAAPCGTGGMAPQILKSITLPASAGVSFTSDRANTLFNWRGLSDNGNPVNVTISSTRGGSVKVYTTGAIARPSACSLARQESSFPVCSGTP